MPVGNRQFVADAVTRAAAGGVMDDLHSLRLLGDKAQEKLLLLRHCLSSKLAHVTRWGPAELFDEATQGLQAAIDDVIRYIAMAPSAMFSYAAI